MELCGLHNTTQEFPPSCVHIPLLNWRGGKCAFSLGVDIIGKKIKTGFEENQEDRENKE